MATKRMVARKKSEVGPKAKSARPPPGAESANTAKAIVRCPTVGEVELEVDSSSAMRWSNAVHHRRRWSDARGMQQAALAASMFPELVEKLVPALRAQAKPHLEVSIPYESEDLGWQARIFPWEYVLSAVARANNVAGKLTVTRHLGLGEATPVSRNGAVLYVESAPCGLRGAWDFSREQDLVARAFSAKATQKGKFHVLRDPSRAELEKTVRALRPEIVHITGFDAQGSIDELRAVGVSEELRAAWNGHDGLLLQEGGAPSWADAERLAHTLTAAQQVPRLVSFNLHHSAARVAALAVARGVESAVAFLDEFEDDVSERFFANFYAGLDASSLYAFAHSLDVLRRSPGKLRGTSVVLWSAKATKHKLEPSAVERTREEYLPDGADLLKLIRVEVQPVSQLNYALLHNHRDLFERFELYKDGEGTLRCLDVEVSLETGGPLATYRGMCDLTEPSTSLKEHIRIPLTAPLARAARESVRTALYVCISARGQTLYKKTHRVTLLPVDEWRDNKQDGMWLPSFVLPRDPAVAQIVAAAQRYLMAISDDPEARFDGYQSIDLTATDPYAAVHEQVRALWSTLLYECSLEYVNPPPTYTVASQRLRTPSDVVAARHGTCIDLSLFVSACLEYIDVFPCIILLHGHAFPAYWRSDADYTAFAMGELPSEGGAAPAPSERALRAQGAVQRVGWYVDASRYKEVLHYVQSGQLVPLESVWLTQRKSFAEALEAGYTNLRSAAEFDSLIDIRQAREQGVTPLPVRGET